MRGWQALMHIASFSFGEWSIQLDETQFDFRQFLLLQGFNLETGLCADFSGV